MNLACPSCDTVYRIDPDRAADGDVHAKCRECGQVFLVEPQPGQRPGVVATAAAAPAGSRGPGGQDEGQDTRHDGGPEEATGQKAAAGEAGPATGAGARPESERAPVFGPQDPDVRAKRLARALVSDIVVYNPQKWERSRETATLRKEFRDEILKSWEEYVEQVGEDMAKRTPYFRDALNDILAEGKRVF